MTAGRAPGWDWVARCRWLGGQPTLELFDELLEAGEEALPFLVELLARRSYREGDPPDCEQLPVHAMRALAILNSPKAIPALLGVLTDPVDPGLHGEEAALALARLGEPALAPLERVLADRQRDTWVRHAAARGLVHAAIADRRLRPRVLQALERLLDDPGERDRMLVAQVANTCCLLPAPTLLPSIERAYAAGRCDEDVTDLESLELDLLTRHHRPDAEAKRAVRRDLREDYPSWEEVSADLDAEDRERLTTWLERAARSATGPPEEGDGVLGTAELQENENDESDE